jgi:hypothetical protein
MSPFISILTLTEGSQTLLPISASSFAVGFAIVATAALGAGVVDSGHGPVCRR